MNKDKCTEQFAKADRYKNLVLARTGLTPEELVCPREQSAMTPCIARDGGLAVGTACGIHMCIGCGSGVDDLLKTEEAKISHDTL